MICILKRNYIFITMSKININLDHTHRISLKAGLTQSQLVFYKIYSQSLLKKIVCSD